MSTKNKRSAAIAALSGDAVTSKPRSPTLARQERKRAAKGARIIAYDFETTRIKAGTPEPKYLTAYAEGAKPFVFDGAIKSIDHLRHILVTRFLTDETVGAKFVAWNGNNFDAYFIAAALIGAEEYVLRPYLTRSNALRGLRVIHRDDLETPNARAWEFLDGIAMLGLVGTPLVKFLANFAPEHGKLVGVIDFDKEEFDSNNPQHREYAMRDSVGLWHGMIRAQAIMLQHFNQPLAVTMGGACIKIFKAHIPRDIEIHTPRDSVIEITRRFVMRGGFCFCVRRYHGPVWKYDINQAYAAAMREAALPCGFTQQVFGAPPKGKPSIVRVTATHHNNIIPFYYRTEIEGRMYARFDTREIKETWITSIELEQLQREGWRVKCHESYFWEDSFNMREYVDKLETLRLTCDGGPSGPIGTMAKATGNHSYGKTVEQIEPIEFVLAMECPPGYVPFYGNDEVNPLEHVYARYVQDQRAKDYHQPQIGAFITAHVRMVLRRAALLDPHAWIYADTDCVVFTRDVTARLDIDKSRYGAWKIEEEGAIYKIIAKKVYSQVDGDKRSAKGMHAKKLSAADFDQWYEGAPPVQDQVQRQNFLIVMRGADMYRNSLRAGTTTEHTSIEWREQHAQRLKCNKRRD